MGGRHSRALYRGCASEPAITVDENRHVAVRDDRYRYIRYRDGREELYDHVDDAPEWRNRANDPALGKVKDRLRKWTPEIFAKPARTKKAYDFDSHAYRWKVKSSGELIEGGECELSTK